MSSILDIPVTRIEGTTQTLSDYRGKVLLIVNVASQCGLTPQYEGLQKLYRTKRAEGLEILGFPANNFNGQQRGTDAQIAEFCSLKYDVQFPLFSKISMKGADQHPLYAALTQLQPAAIDDGPFRERLKGYGIDTGTPSEVLWNFEKFLVDRKGEVVARFAPDIAPDDPHLLQAIDEQLARQ